MAQKRMTDGDIRILNSKIKSFGDMLTTAYKNDLGRFDFIEKTRHLLTDEIKAYSNILNHVMLTDDPYFTLSKIIEEPVFETHGDQQTQVGTISKIAEIPLANVSNGTRLFVTATERDMAEIGMETVKKKLMDKVVDTVENAVITALLQESQDHTGQASMMNKILEAKDLYGQKEFVVGASLKNILDLKSKNITDLPIPVFYVPRLDKEVAISFQPDRVYVNVVMGSIDYKKNIMTGIYDVAISILSMDVYCDDDISGGKVYKL